MEAKNLIFLSYAHEDYDFANQLYNDLKKAGINIWLDKKSILPGKRWRTEIQKAIKNSRFFLILLSSNSVSKRGFVQKEVKIALDILDEFLVTDVFVIPIRLNECTPINEKIKELQWVDLFPSRKEGLEKIINVIKQENKKDLIKKSTKKLLYKKRSPIKKQKHTIIWSISIVILLIFIFTAIYIIKTKKSNQIVNASHTIKLPFDASLRSLSISEGILRPLFDPNIFNYTVKVASKIDKIRVSAESKDKRAEIDGLGEKKLTGDLNTINIKVTAIDGTIQKYIINIIKKKLILNDNFIFVAAGYEGILVFDNNIPYPNFLYNYKIDNYVSKIRIEKNFAYILTDAGLKILDITNKINLKEIGHNKSEKKYRKIRLSADYIYLLDKDGFDIIDASDKNNPVKISSYYTGSRGYVSDLYISENYAYVTNRQEDEGFFIVDISDKTNPKRICFYPCEGDHPNPGGISIIDDYAYFHVDDELIILNIANKTNPIKENTLSVGDSYADEISIAEDFLYISRGHGFQILDILNRSEPKYISSYYFNGDCTKIKILGDYAYIFDRKINEYNEGLKIINLANKHNPIDIGQYPSNDSAEKIVIKGNYAYVADQENALLILDISDKFNPINVGSYNIKSRGREIIGDLIAAKEEEYIYITITNGYNRLEILDITDKYDPICVNFFRGSRKNRGSRKKIKIKDNHLYSADGSGVTIFEIVNNKNPIKIGTYDSVFSSYMSKAGIDIMNDYLYFGEPKNGLVILDISDKSKLVKIGNYDIGINAIQIEGNYAYVADEYKGFVVLDITDRSRPKSIGYYEVDIADITINGNYAYVSGRGRGVIILDISEKSNLRVTGTFDTNGITQNITVEGNYAYVADGPNGIIILDISDKYNPILIKDMLWVNFQDIDVI